MKIIFIRHGEPDYEKDSLTEKGFREAEALAKRVSAWKIDALYCSPLGRAQATVKRTEELLQRKAVILPWLEEFRGRIFDPSTNREHGPWDFMPSYWTKQEKLYHYDTWFQAEMMNDSVRQIYQETCDGIDAILREFGYYREGKLYQVAEPREATIVNFCHMAITFAMLAHLLGIAPPLLWQGFFLAPSSVSIVGAEEREAGAAAFRCQVLGDTTHLYAAKEPISQAGYFTTIFQQ